MKTNDNTSAMSHTNFLVIAAGIVIAFICSLVLFQTANSSERTRSEGPESYNHGGSPSTVFELPAISPKLNGAAQFVSILLARN